MRRSQLPLLLLAAVGLAAVALAQSDWKSVTSREGTLTALLPPNWVLNSVGDAEMAKRLEEFKASNPRLAQLMDPKTNERQILLAFDPANRVDSLNVIKNPGAGLTPDMYDMVADALKSSLAQSLVGEFRSAKIDLPVGRAFKYWMTMKAKTNGVESILDLYNVMFVHSDQLYVVTFGTEAGQMKSRQAVWDKIIASIKVK
jgi:hypothetical protein